MNLSDKTADEQLKHQIELDRLKSNLNASMTAIMLELEGEVIAKLARLDPTGTKSLRYRSSRTTRLLSSVDGMIGVHFGSMEKAMKEKLWSIAENESKLTIKTLNKLIGVELLEQLLSRSEINTIVDETLFEGATNAEWWNNQKTRFKRKFSQTMRIGVGLGETTEALTTRVRSNFPRSLIGNTRKETSALIRTSVQAISNASRLRSFQANDDVIKAIQWISTLDTHTTDICIGLSNLQWKMEKNGLYTPIGHDKLFPGATAHWACRSTQIAVTKSWDELNKRGAVRRKGKNNKSIEEIFRRDLIKSGKSPLEVQSIMMKTRASMNGQVAAETTFDQFWGRMSKTEQIARFGKTRTELFREGRLSMSDLTDQSNRPRTIEQIYEIL